jgi:hypothetical protein
VSDVTILVDDQDLGQSVVEEIGQTGTRCVSTFERDAREGRRKKLGFFMGDARIKATTLHSFKGWETRALVLCIRRAFDQRSKALLYAGLTRLKQHPQGSFLVVVCSEPELLAYGRTWPDFSYSCKSETENASV